MDGSDHETDDLIGTAVGRYKIVRKLGQGGMGAVYLGEHAAIRSRVAVKVLHPEYARRKSIVERFFAEAQAVNTIRHENIVQIVDLALLPDRRPYLVMEYLEGRALSRHLKEAPKGLDVKLSLAVAVQVADALAAAHEHRIVHRDLKPDNVFLVPRRRGAPLVKLLDFGIAKLMDDSDSASGNNTQTGAILGTPKYMSPEQAAGRTREIDWRTDVYAFGVILFHMLTGHVPFSAPAFGDLMIQHLHATPPRPRAQRSEVSEAVEGVVLRCLAKKAADRFQRMDEASEILRAELARLGGPGELGGAAVGPEAVAGVPAVEPSASSGARSGPGPEGTITGAGAQLEARPAPRRGRMFAIAAGAAVVFAGAGFVAVNALLGGDGEVDAGGAEKPHERNRPAKPAREGDVAPERADDAPATAPAKPVPAAEHASTAERTAAPATGATAAAAEDGAARTAKASGKADELPAGKSKGPPVADKHRGKAAAAPTAAPATSAPKGTAAPSKVLDDSTLSPKL